MQITQRADRLMPNSSGFLEKELLPILDRDTGKSRPGPRRVGELVAPALHYYALGPLLR